MGVPIGTARDITLRALDVLASADVLVAEDTRSLRKLMDIHAIPLDGRRVEALHDHSKDAAVARLVEKAHTASVAYASEAGMPGIADPGFELARAAHAAGVMVTSAPGPSAVITAIASAGLPTDAFFFCGFLPAARAARQKALAEHKHIPGTLAYYESPKRVGQMLADAAQILGPDRHAAMCRELTKRFEEIRSDTLQNLAQTYAKASVKGEIVILISRAISAPLNDFEIDSALRSALRHMSVKDAASFVAQSCDIPRRRAYQRALALDRDAAPDT